MQDLQTGRRHGVLGMGTNDMKSIQSGYKSNKNPHREALMLAKNADDLKRVLREMKKKRIIKNQTYCDYALLIVGATRPEQLDEIAYDLDEIRRPLYRVVSF